MNKINQTKQAKKFVERWSGKGYEKGEGQKFWIDLLQSVLGMQDAIRKCQFERQAPNGGFIDVFIPDCNVLIEQKGIHVDLDKPEMRQGKLVTPFQQALAYVQSFKPTSQPRFIVTCNFETFRIYDRESCDTSQLENHPFEFTLTELASHPQYLAFITDPQNSRQEKEKEITFLAGEQIGKIYAELQKRYINPDSPESQHALNVLCVRLVFCLFCEDVEGLFPKDGFLHYLRNVSCENMRDALKKLFRALDTPINERDPYDETIKNFPYVNGGLFSEETEIPNFDEQLKHMLLYKVSQNTNWAEISPTIFGGIFEGTLNPQTRRQGGMHYTSPENIHKVIDPLFLNELYEDYSDIMTDDALSPLQKKNRLQKLHEKICSLTFLDPACGSGNFLTETFLSLRRLEDDIIRILNAGQTEINFGQDALNDRVSLDQFFGIEINDFAVSVANVALWIAKLQANSETLMTLDLEAKNFPLTDSAHIIEGNALRLNWEDVLPAQKCSYIIGNPPFVGERNQTAEQKQEVIDAFHGAKNCGNIDYVAGWYAKACDYVTNENVRCAFVSTNSICQGEQVANVWKPIFDAGFHIDFAHNTFRWANEASDAAHVFCVIVGFSKQNMQK